MCLTSRLVPVAFCVAACFNPAVADTVSDEKMLRALYDAALTTSPAYAQLRELTTKYPGRLSGSRNLEGAVLWGEAVLQATGADVGPLLAHGATVAGLQPDSQRYFDIHHTAEDSFDKVNQRELELGAAAMASLVYLVDQYGL